MEKTKTPIKITVLSPMQKHGEESKSAQIVCESRDLFEAGSPIPGIKHSSLNSSGLISSNGQSLSKSKGLKPKQEDPLIDKFNKQYSKITIGKDVPFEERMKFDIFKRATKMDRFEYLCKQTEKRLPKASVDSTFNQLVKDAQRRNQSQQRVKENEEVQQDRQRIKEERKISLKEGKQIYEDHMERWKLRNAVIEEKRKILAYQEELEVIQRKNLDKQVAQKYQQSPNCSNSSPRLLERMEEDIDKRRQKAAVIAQRDESEVECEEFHHPQVNCVPYSASTHCKSELNKTVYERMAKDINKRTIKMWQKEIGQNREKSFSLKKSLDTMKKKTMPAEMLRANVPIKEICQKRDETKANKKEVPQKNKFQSQKASPMTTKPSTKLPSSKIKSTQPSPRNHRAQAKQPLTQNKENQRCKSIYKLRPKTDIEGKFILHAKAEKIIEGIYSNFN